MLAAILVLYSLIIIGGSSLGNPARVIVLGFLVWTSTRLQADRRLRWWALAIGIAALAVTALVSAIAPADVVFGVVGGLSVILIGLAIGTIASTLLGRLRVDISTVLGVLCIYLLLAQFFAATHQLLAAFSTAYLNGTPDPPTPSDLLYFSVITLTTVGFGDITPASQLARAVTVTEALTGQLYLVSVVAGVVGGWRSTSSQGPPS